MIDKTGLERLLQKHLEKVKDKQNELDVALGNMASGSVEAAAVFSRLDNSFFVLLVPVRPLDALPLDIT